MRIRVKICGLTRAADARLAAQRGADYLGVILAPGPRRVAAAEAATWIREVHQEFPGSRWVGVFVRPSAAEIEDAVGALGLDLAQVHGLSPVDRVATRVPWILATTADRVGEIPGFESSDDPPRSLRPPCCALVDSAAGGGSGKPFDWSVLPPPPRPYRLFLAGGLGPSNVVDAIRRVRPYAVDASSRLESRPGEKDPARLTAFFAAVSCANALPLPPPEGSA